MKKHLLLLILVITSLTISTNIDSSEAKPIVKSESAPKATNLKLAIDLFFKTGTLEESWFAQKDPPEPGSFEKFKEQALQSRKLVLTLYGAYKLVRKDGNDYIAVFERRELGIQFKLDKQGRIAGISTK